MLKVVGRRKIDRSRVRRILIRSTNWVGDAVMMMPALQAVREIFPQSKITVLAKPWVVPLFENHPAVDEIIALQAEHKFSMDLPATLSLVWRIRKGRFDLAILFQNAFRAAFLTFLGGVRWRVGYATDGRGFLLTHRVSRNGQLLQLHQTEYYLWLLRSMKWETKAEDPVLRVAPADKARAADLLSKHGVQPADLVMGIGPGAIFGAAKRWPPERFAAIADRMVERWGGNVIVMGSRREGHICESLIRAMRNPALNFCGRTSLGEAMALVERCRAFVTNDSGLMHVAAALGVPTVAIFGATNALATGPRGPKTRVVQRPTDCAPCLKRNCPTDHRCMLSIQPAEVWEQLESLGPELG
jgi:heptosyltransferase-2